MYDEAKITGNFKDGSTDFIAARLLMEPFGTFDSEIEIHKTADSYFYSMKNLDDLRYRDSFNAVGKEKMQSVITVFRDGDNWVMYAIGGADLAWVPFVGNRIKTSFMNRIQAFCNYVFEKI